MIIQCKYCKREYELDYGLCPYCGRTPEEADSIIIDESQKGETGSTDKNSGVRKKHIQLKAFIIAAAIIMVASAIAIFVISIHNSQRENDTKGKENESNFFHFPDLPLKTQPDIHPDTQSQEPEHVHSWMDATCTDPRTCSVCGITDGNPLGHKWKSATCTDPSICSVCGAIEGEPLGHTWMDATCTDSSTCSVCGATEGEPLGHTWIDATCTNPRICSICGVTDGLPLGHDMLPATYNLPATCSRCGLTTGKSLKDSVTIVASGPCDFGLSWTLDDLGMLRVTGTGEMDVFLGAGAYNDQPWFEYRERIISAVIEDGVINVSDCAFSYCSNLTSILIPKSVTMIGNAFSYCPNFTDIYYSGTAVEWAALTEDTWLPKDVTIHYNWTE